MKDPKVYAHVPYIGTTGYNNHSRDFLRKLSELVDVKVRNYTIGKSWKYMQDEPHNSESYITDVDKKLLIEQTLQTNESRVDSPIYSKYPNNFTSNVNLVLNETNHHYYYDQYVGPKIAYNVWETTLQPPHFFQKLLDFDEIWVPSKWQRDCTVAQGADYNKVKVVPEGVDIETFYPEDYIPMSDYEDGRFKFVLFGRWEYRKATKEIVETFLKTFTPNDPVDLILSADNRFADDGFNSTEERLEHFGFTDERIKVKHFPSREDYITYLKNGHIFLSCARSEGWNLPLIEAMACGTPSIYSNCSGQTEFAQNKGLPVKITGEKPNPNSTGNYYEPDFEDLSNVMRDAFENYTDHKKRAIEEAKLIHRDFNWDNVAKIGQSTLSNFLKNYVIPEDSNQIKVSYLNNPKVEILGSTENQYKVEFINRYTQEIIHTDNISNNMWTKCNKTYYIPWDIKVNNKLVSSLDLKGKRVLISLNSKSIGDTIGWAPYAIEFAKKHQCKVVLSTFHNDWFKNLEPYKNIDWLEPGNATECSAHYIIGWFKNEKGEWDSSDHHPRRCNTIPMQATATDILGLDYIEVNHGVDFPKLKRPIKDKYIAIGPNATSGCKEWVYENWVILTKLLIKSGYTVVCLSQRPYPIEGAINIVGEPLSKVANYLHHADYFIGLGSGLSWLNWAIGKHTHMINGFSENGHEFNTNITRIMNDNVCFPCWTNRNFTFDAGDWDWCPIHKGTEKQHICQKSITPLQVYSSIIK